MTRTRSRGSLLIMSLWLVVILSVLAVAVARSLSVDLRLAKYRQAHDQARALARGGVWLAMQRLARDAAVPEEDGKMYDWYGDDWAQASDDEEPGVWRLPFPEAGGSAAHLTGEVRIRIGDELGKLRLNSATGEELARLTNDAAMAQEIVDARDESDPVEDRPEANPPYFAKNGPFASLAELSDFSGVTPGVYEALRQLASPYTLSSEPMNINTVIPEVLLALGISESAVGLIARFREGMDGSDAHEQDGVFTEAGAAIVQTLKDREGVDLTGTPDGNLLTTTGFGVASDVFAVVSESRMQRPAARFRVEAVVRRAGCGDGAASPCIVAWREG